MRAKHPSDIVFRFRHERPCGDLCVRIRAYKESIKKDELSYIEDAVSSYIDSVDGWNPGGLITDVMGSFGLTFLFVESWCSYGPADEYENTIYI